mgnify:CR=1 FL=1
MPTAFANLIDGRAVDSTERTTDINPSNLGDGVGEFARATTSDVDQAIAGAREAFKKWSRTSPQERFDILDRAGTEILARKDEMGRLLSREPGKPLADACEDATAGLGTDEVDGFAAKLSAWLAGWAARGFFVGVELGG